MNLSDCRQLEQDVWTYEEEDVKQFIKELKKRTSCKMKGNCLVLRQGEIHEIINELAGEGLI